MNQEVIDCRASLDAIARANLLDVVLDVRLVDFG
jgi:hypothetical protein